jgi:hypothetical protein
MDQLMGKLLADMIRTLQWFMKQPSYVKAAVLVPAMVVNAILFIAVNAIAINLGAGNQHLSSNDNGFDAWLIWIIVAVGLVLGGGLGGFIYFGAKKGGGEEPYDEDDQGETGMLEV